MNDRERVERFTAQAKNALYLAREEAERYQHNSIGMEHLLLGLVREEEGVAATMLVNLGIELNAVHKAIEVIMGHGDRVVSGKIDLTPRAKKVVERAVDEARRLNHRYIGTEHLLLSLVREGEGIATGMLESLGTNLERIQTQIIQEFGQSDVLHEETSIQVFSQSGTPHEKFDTESLDPPLTNEREARGIYIWSQEASDNLGKLAADAAKAAQKNPGQWVNPLKSYLLSRIRYAQTPSQIRQFFLEAILDEKIFKEKLHEYNSGYYQIDYPKMNMLLIRV
ncbi:MAG: Clp protease N-terminal domain-containing protein, partial [Ktedonobacteraceae bacterium]